MVLIIYLLLCEKNSCYFHQGFLQNALRDRSATKKAQGKDGNEKKRGIKKEYICNEHTVTIK